MNKRILVTSTDLMMIQFLVPHVKNLSQNGFDVEIACSDVGGRMGEVREALDEFVRAIHVVRLERNPAKPKNMLGYGDLKRVINKGSYDVIWTNEPVMGVMTRLAARKARKRGTKVVYMVHGFHFFTGAPKKYWLTFYPIEMFMSQFCDVIVTVNKEDYHRARRMHAKAVKYIHGIGVNTDRLNPGEQQSSIREELGLPAGTFLVLSVGELNDNKNQKVVIKAVSRLKNKDIHYLICGKGANLEQLQRLTQELKVEKQVHFLGYRKDVVDICSQANVFVLPSYREGLPVATLESMYAGLPLITSKVRGVVDFLEDGKNGFLCDADDDKAFAEAIQKLYNHPELCERFSHRNRRVVEPYSIDNTKQAVLNLMKDLM